MRKRFIFFFTLLLVITLFIGINHLNRNESDIWVSIDNLEWENYESFAGTGMYFFEENNKKYCLFMLYGSGLPVISYHQSEVKVINNQEIEIEVPNHLINLMATDQEIKKHRVTLQQGNLMMNKMIYKASQTPMNYKHILK